jgi:isopenicillin N synthase-like dioxygenase
MTSQTSTNKLLGLSPSEGMPYPDLLAKHNDSLAFFVEKCHWLGTILLERFSAVLCHRHAVSLQQNHRYGKPSTSALGLLKYPATAASAIDKLGQIAHTDVGSITVLFAQLGGLQVLGNKGEWEFVQPKPGHAVINIGDSLRFLTGKRLRSSLHRVVPHPDASHRPRYSLAYFMRPEYDAQFEDEDGAQWTGLGWHTRKFAVFRASVEQQKNDSVLTGRKGYLGLWKEGTNGERELPA